MPRILKKANIREAQIEDVLATYPDLLKEILSIREDLTLIARQRILPSGDRLDLLFVSGKRILLIELKIEAFRREFLKQTVDYVSELKQLQVSDELIEGDIVPYLLCTNFKNADNVLCNEKNVCLIKYSPESVLESFFARLKSLAGFISLKPTNHGLWNLHLLNRILYILEEPESKDRLAKTSSLSKSTIGSYLSLAQELLLVNENEGQWYLTDIGKEFVCNKDPEAPVELISEEQSKVLQNVIIQNPFGSGAIIGIYAIVEALFNLSKNTYPVPRDLLTDHFRKSSGRYFEWSSTKTADDSMRMYSNYAIDIGLMGRMGDKYYLTPDGIRFILLLNLHKAIKIIDALGLSTS